MVKVKICGITRYDEIAFLNKLKPDYIGFVFAESRRQVTPEYAASLAVGLDDEIKKVGVFVDADPEYVAAAAKTAGLSVLQLHGNESCGYIKMLRDLVKSGTEIWKAFCISSCHLPDISLLAALTADRILLDTFVTARQGGTGECFDWSLVSRLQISLPLILAGGLSQDNIKEAIIATAPFAVDTSSGVEKNGIKNEQRVKEFIKVVKR